MSLETINPAEVRQLADEGGLAEKEVIFMSDEIYKGPDFSVLSSKINEPAGTYTVIKQAIGFGVPKDQLTPEEHEPVVADNAVKQVE